MKTVRRFKLGQCPLFGETEIVPATHGDYVTYTDYRELKDELLHKINLIKNAEVNYAELQARLDKAIEQMEKAFNLSLRHPEYRLAADEHFESTLAEIKGEK